MEIPLLDLTAQYRSLKPQLDAAALRVLASGRYVLGPEVEAFEAELAAYCGVRHAVAVNSGTSALHLALLASGIGPGDEVITTPFTFVATVAAILYTGARPVLVDIEPSSLTIDPERVEAAITARTRAIMPVHLHGQTADMASLRDLANAHGVALIEDAAQAHGALCDGRPAGSLGRIAAFSFYPGKNLGAVGEGGALTTDRPDLAQTARLLRDWGAERRYHHVLQGFNYRMDEMQGAILRVKLEELERWTEARRAVADRYRHLLWDSGVGLPVEAPGRRHVYHVFAIRHEARDDLASRLAARGVGTGIHYPVPVHLQPAYADLGYRAGDLPVAERAAREVLSLPIYPELTRAQVEAVAAAVQEALPALLGR